MTVTELTDRSLVLVLQELAEELPVEGDASEIADADEARLVLTELLAVTGEDIADVFAALRDDEHALAAARRLLDHATADDIAGPVARRLIDDPPVDDQLAVDLALSGVVVLGALVTLLQTRVHFRLTREKGETKVDFEIDKRAASDAVLKRMASVVLQILGR